MFAAARPRTAHAPAASRSAAAMVRASAPLAAFVAFAALAGAGLLAAQGDPGGQVSDQAIHLAVEPADLLPGATVSIPDRRLRTLPGVPLRIRGLTVPTLAGQAITVVVTPPQTTLPPEGMVPVPPARMVVTVDRGGAFEAAYVPAAVGEHRVDAADATARYRGTTTFEVVSARETGQQVKQQAEQLARELRRLLQAIRAAIAALPPSPAQDDALGRQAQFEPQVIPLLPETGPDWLPGIDHADDLRGTYPQVREQLRPLEQKLEQWHAEAGPRHQQVRQQIAELTAGNELCDILSEVVHATKLFAYTLQFLLKPRDFFVDWAKGHSVPALLARVPAVHHRPTLNHTLDLGWKGLVTFAPKIPGVATANHGLDRLVDGNLWQGEHEKARLERETVTKFIFEAAEFFAGLALHRYCEEFSGDWEASMTARFFDQGNLWWKYEMKLKGRLTLRYPKDGGQIGPEPPAGGRVITVTGEFAGYPTHYQSWDNAVPVLFPELGASSLLLKKVWEPLGGEWIQSSFLGPFSVGHAGDYTQFYTVPGFFRVPVRGRLQGKSVTLDLLDTNLGGPLTFTKKKADVFLVMLSPLAMLTTTSYALPYKDGPFVIRRATHEAPLAFTVRYEGKTMVIEESYDRERSTGDTLCKYRLHLKVCNPGCASHGGGGASPIEM